MTERTKNGHVAVLGAKNRWQNWNLYNICGLKDSIRHVRSLWNTELTRLLATLQCESIEHMSSLERENRRRIGVPERTTVLKRVFSTRNRTEIPIPASICCSDASILRYSR